MLSKGDKDIRILWLALATQLFGCTASEQQQAISNFPKADITYLSFSTQHGVQIEYLSPKGGAYLWYPGNTSVVSGEWEVVLNKICYRYGPQTYNPVTRQAGGRWECQFAVALDSRDIAELTGDPFKLSQRKRAPYTLQRCTFPPEFQIESPPEC